MVAATIPLLVVVIGLLAVVAAWRMGARRAAVEAGEPLQELELFGGIRGRIVIVVPTTLLLVALWLKYDLSIAILVPASIPVWAFFLSDRDDLSPVVRRRVGLGLIAAGVLFLATLVVGAAVFITR